MPTILVIEDDSAIRQGVTDALRFAGYEPLAAADGRDGLRLALEAHYQLLLLDLVLPHQSGLQILKTLKTERPGQAVIILSAKGREADRIEGLSLGADDYMVKPFSVRELLARVNAVLRRSTERPPALTQWHFPHGEVDFARQEIRRPDGTREPLSTKACELLRYLASHPGRAVAREEILRHVWDLNPNGIETRTIDMHIAHLRAKIGADQLLTVRGQGYMLAQKGATPGDYSEPSGLAHPPSSTPPSL